MCIPAAAAKKDCNAVCIPIQRALPLDPLQQGRKKTTSPIGLHAQLGNGPWFVEGRPGDREERGENGQGVGGRAGRTAAQGEERRRRRRRRGAQSGMQEFRLLLLSSFLVQTGLSPAADGGKNGRGKEEGRKEREREREREVAMGQRKIFTTLANIEISKRIFFSFRDVSNLHF